MTQEQARLIDAITNYSVNLAKASGQSDLAEEMETKISISHDIQRNINALTPKQSRGLSL